MLKQIIDKIEAFDLQEKQNENNIENKYNSLKEDYIDSIRTFSNEYLNYLELINSFVRKNKLDEKLSIKYKLIEDISLFNMDGFNDNLERARVLFDELFECEKISRIIKINEELSSCLSYINSYRVYAEEIFERDNKHEVYVNNSEYRKTLLNSLKEQIDKIKQNNLVLIEKCYQEENRNIFDNDFVLFKKKYDQYYLDKLREYGFKLDDENEYISHNFYSNKEHNIALIHNNERDIKAMEVWENIFLRLFHCYSFDALQVQPLGKISLKLNGLFLNYNNKYESYKPVNKIINNKEEIINFFKSLEDELNNRAALYYISGDFSSYNKDNKDNPSKAIFIYINNLPFDCEINELINNLLENECYKYGIFFLIDSINEDEEIIKRNEFRLFKLEEDVITYKNKEIEFSIYGEKFDKKAFFKRDK